MATQMPQIQIDDNLKEASISPQRNLGAKVPQDDGLATQLNQVDAAALNEFLTLQTASEGRTAEPEIEIDETELSPQKAAPAPAPTAVQQSNIVPSTMQETASASHDRPRTAAPKKLKPKNDEFSSVGQTKPVEVITEQEKPAKLDKEAYIAKVLQNVSTDSDEFDLAPQKEQPAKEQAPAKEAPKKKRIVKKTKKPDDSISDSFLSKIGKTNFVKKAQDLMDNDLFDD